MNKKFSTLVAVLLAAGAWTTLDAKVVEVTKPVPGGSYVIGSVFTDGSAVLLQSDDAAVEGTQTVSSATGKWTLVDASSDYSGCFYLKGDADKFIAAGNGSTDAATLSLKTEGELSTTHAKVPFSYINGELVVASAFTNNNVKDKELNIVASSIVAVADASAQHTALFGVYAADSKVPGFDLNVNDDGQLIFTDDVAAPNFAAPVYFQINSKYLYVSGKDVKVDMDAAPKAGEAVGASWRWENGKLVSVAAENAEADVKAKYLNVVLKEGALAYSLVEQANATTFAIAGNAITATNGAAQVSLTSPAMYASAVLANAQSEAEVTIAGGSNVVAGDLQILDAPSGYVVISLQKDGTTKYLKAGAANTYESNITLAEDLTNGDPKEYEKYLWNVSSKTLGGKAYYTFTSLAKNGDKNYVAFEEYQANAAYSKQGITLGDGSQFVGINGTLGNDPAVIGFYDAFQLAKTQAQLDGIYSPGFEMTVKVSKDGKETIEDIDVFGKTMYPKASNTTNVGETTVQLWDNNKTDAKGAKLLALDKTKTFDSTSPIVGEFVWITPAELTKNSANYETGFQVIYSLGDPALIEEVEVDG